MEVNFRAVTKRRVGTGSHSQSSACIDFYVANIDYVNSYQIQIGISVRKLQFSTTPTDFPSDQVPPYLRF
jgi:hypothetical protein